MSQKKIKKNKKDINDLILKNISNYDDNYNDYNDDTMSSRSKSKRNISIINNKKSIKVEGDVKQKIDKRHLRVDKLKIYGNIFLNINDDGKNSFLRKGLKKLKCNDIDICQSNERIRNKESDNDDNDNYIKTNTSRSQSKLFKLNGTINEVATSQGEAIQPIKDIIEQNPYPLSFNSSPRNPQNLTSSHNPSPQYPRFTLSPPKTPVEVSPSPSPVVNVSLWSSPVVNVSPSSPPVVNVSLSSSPVVNVSPSYQAPPIVVSYPPPIPIIILPSVVPTIQPLYQNPIILQQNASYQIMNVAPSQQIIYINNY